MLGFLVLDRWISKMYVNGPRTGVTYHPRKNVVVAKSCADKLIKTESIDETYVENRFRGVCAT
jgi:hypothetical protein